MIEVEVRGLLSKDKYSELLRYLHLNADSKSVDNKVAKYYNFEKGILKVVNEISRKKTKLSLKLGDECASQGMWESEVYLQSKKDLDNCEDIISSLGYRVKSIVNQKRVNFVYKGVEWAIKYTDDWGYHFEAEVMVKNRSDAEIARRKIYTVCGDLGIKPLSPDELRTFLAKL